MAVWVRVIAIDKGSLLQKNNNLKATSGKDRKVKKSKCGDREGNRKQAGCRKNSSGT